MPVANLPGVQLHYVQLPSTAPAGVETTPIVMVHGLATNLAFWYAGIAPAFTRHGPVTLYDLRGHGRSTSPDSGYGPEAMQADLKGLLDHLGLDSVHLLGHSYGGLVALVFAARNPERVKSLVLADVRVRSFQPRMTLREWRHADRFRQSLEGTGITIDEDHPDAGLLLLVESARQQARFPYRPQKLQEAFFGHVRIGAPRAAERWLNMMESTSALRDITDGEDVTPAELSRLDIPILALFGEYSMAVRSGEMLTRVCPNCTLRVIPRVGHFFPLVRREAFLRPSLRFLRRQIHAGRRAPVLDVHPA